MWCKNSIIHNSTSARPARSNSAFSYFGIVDIRVMSGTLSHNQPARHQVTAALGEAHHAVLAATIKQIGNLLEFRTADKVLDRRRAHHDLEGQHSGIRLAAR